MSEANLGATGEHQSIIVRGPEALPGLGFSTAYDFWRSARSPGKLPPMSVLSALKLPKELLTRVAIAGVEDGPKRFRIRLVGTRTVQDIGFDATKTMGEDIAGGEEIIRVHDQCLALREPILAQGRASWSPNDFKSYKTLLLPFVDNADAIKRILSYVELS